MDIEYQSDRIIVHDIDHFSLDEIFDCGQAFRWQRDQDGSYTGVAYGRILKIRQDSKDLTFYTSREDFDDIWLDYFDLKTDYAVIKKSLSCDDVLQKAIPFGSGIRILKQDAWECLITFIISQQNNIPRIKDIISNLCRNFGEEIECDNGGRMYHCFPGPEKIMETGLGGLESIRCGFRAQYIVDAAEKVLTNQINLNGLRDLPTPQGREELLKIKGVGPKVASCVLLFSLGKMDSFPVDTWMNRVIHTFYDHMTFDPCVFGEYCGIAQQYLFYYARKNKIKISKQ